MRKKKGGKKQKTRKRCRSEGEPNRCEYGEINAVVGTASNRAGERLHGGPGAETRYFHCDRHRFNP